MGNEVLIKSQDSVLLKAIIIVMMMIMMRHVGDDGEGDEDDPELAQKLSDKITQCCDKVNIYFKF